MTRIGRRFAELKERKEKALVPFFFAGDPDIDATYELVLELEKAGADIVELGIPYTDPLADGPVNQAAAARALKNDITLTDILDMVKRLRKVTQVPIAFLLYFNCVLQYGVERFLQGCEKCGVDGLVIPDLPYEERLRYTEIFARHDVDMIPLVTPVSGERIEKIVAGSSGFIYCVTSTGTTGVRSDFDTDFDRFMSEVAAHTDTPRVLGFGISTTAQVSKLKGYGEGVIVGSAIVKRMEAQTDAIVMIEDVAQFVRQLKAAQR
ncbi:MAG: tryptophan synthase subunit alpha [Clostridia bacterium]|jgi:tryptophan synthase alpha chain|nr:tryptophan synthase subunit alpha [Clostridia bacterium]MBT7122387.1 tryptophan synthase subunit alpha [Clostridia bacterium]